MDGREIGDYAISGSTLHMFLKFDTQYREILHCKLNMTSEWKYMEI